MSELPVDPLSEMGAAAVGLHEVYLALRSVGFTDSQALYLVGQILAAHVFAATMPQR